MGKIVAMGGGSISRPDYDLAIDREVIRLSGKKRPRVLFVPTASNDMPVYIEKFMNLYQKRLKCEITTLRLYPQAPSRYEIDRLVDTADVIYVGGGNTLKMIARWKLMRVDRALKRAYIRGAVLCGPSAGAIAWFLAGHSDSRKFRNPGANYIRVSALGYIPALLCPHYDSEPKRRPTLKKMAKRLREVAFGVQENAALEILDDTYRVIVRGKDPANIYRCYWKGNNYYEEPLPIKKGFLPLKPLFSKEYSLS
jgi:dipeptidase E